MANQQYDTRVQSAPSVDSGLRAYFLQVYNYMASALIVTGLVAFFSGTSEAFLSMMQGEKGGPTPIAYVLMLAPLGFVLILGTQVQKMSYKSAQIAFWAFAVVMGLSLYYIFAFYTGTSIARVFFITSAMFGSMSLYGYTTKRDLTGLGSFLFMGVIGIVIAGLVNLFIQSTIMHMVISMLAVLIFTGMTAYDTQRLKEVYYQVAGSGRELVGKASIMGALSLYIDFINIFVSLMSLLGERK